MLKNLFAKRKADKALQSEIRLNESLLQLEKIAMGAAMTAELKRLEGLRIANLENEIRNLKGRV